MKHSIVLNQQVSNYVYSDDNRKLFYYSYVEREKEIRGWYIGYSLRVLPYEMNIKLIMPKDGYVIEISNIKLSIPNDSNISAWECSHISLSNNPGLYINGKRQFSINNGVGIKEVKLANQLFKYGESIQINNGWKKEGLPCFELSFDYEEVEVYSRPIYNKVVKIIKDFLNRI